jgi:hypothetical protein
MIFIDKSLPLNTVTLTLQEKSNIWDTLNINPEYLFSLSSDTTGSIINFISTNIAPVSARTRYDQFSWDNTVTSGLTPEIFWSYSVYEQMTGSTNTNPLGLNQVETGKLFAKGVPQAPITYYNNTGTTSIISYSTPH